MTTPAPPPAPPGTLARHPGGHLPRIWPWILVLVGGVIVAATGLGLFLYFGLSGFFHNTVEQAPTTVTIRCTPGDYFVYQVTGPSTGSGRAAGGASSSATLTTADVRVTNPEGGSVGTWTGSGNQTISTGSSVYTNAVGFHASRTGDYIIEVAAVNPSAIIIAPSIGTQFVRAAPWLVLLGVGALAAAVGLVLLIVTAVRRGRTRRDRMAMVGSSGWSGPGHPAYPPPSADPQPPPPYSPQPGHPQARPSGPVPVEPPATPPAPTPRPVPPPAPPSGPPGDRPDGPAAPPVG